MDTADAAQREIDRELNQALSARRPTAPVGDKSLRDCLECGLRIPAARRRALPGTQYCVECADLIERGLV